jgi:hypothetical protein
MLKITRADFLPIEESSKIEIAERKGLGHPDTVYQGFRILRALWEIFLRKKKIYTLDVSENLWNANMLDVGYLSSKYDINDWVEIWP